MAWNALSPVPSISKGLPAARPGSGFGTIKDIELQFVRKRST
ncbi:MAG: hypothetical protein ABJF23_09770 [Bryobacteraceae bacterium]